MRRSKPVRIGELWSGFVKESPMMTRKLCEARIPEVWAAVVGEAVASLTTSVAMKNGVLYVALSSSVARHEIFMKRAALQQEINRRLGMEVISNIIVK